MKPTLICLGLLALAGPGCLSDRGTKKDVAKPPAAELVEPARIRPEEVNEDNLHSSLQRLDEEVKYDERPARSDPKPDDTKPKR